MFGKGIAMRDDAPAPQWLAGKDFTNDWQSRHIPTWTRALHKFRNQPVAVLEIGSFEGLSAVAFLELLPRCRITCVDPFAGYENRATFAHLFAHDYESRFDQNLAPYRDRFEKIKARSVPTLDALRREGRHFDVIYIDGSHERQDVLSDSILAWPLLKVGGVLIWDDYQWEHKTLPPDQRPEQAIDLFRSMFAPCFKELHRGYQLIGEKQSLWPAPNRFHEAAYQLRRTASRLRRSIRKRFW
jgi:predicted O-methyltransferase YrrM